jgi:hypothetical protein
MNATGFSQRIQELKVKFRHAFAIQPDGQPLAAQERALLEKVATAVVARRMTGPALLFLESAGPVNFLSSQALHFLAPILDLACDARELEQAACLLERRDAIPSLIELIEAKSAPAKPAPDGAPVR